MFYEKLFQLRPALRTMFKTSITEQAKKLTYTLGVLMGSLDRFDTLRPTLQLMGKAHVRYGVQPEDYSTVGQALLATMEAMLGAKFDAPSRAAWTKLLSLVSAEMLEGAATPSVAAAAV
jgi:hemoglobin-like flavoprotein